MQGIVELFSNSMQAPRQLPFWHMIIVQDLIDRADPAVSVPSRTDGMISGHGTCDLLKRIVKGLIVSLFSEFYLIVKPTHRRHSLCTKSL